MKAILKKVGRPAQVVEIKDDFRWLREMIGCERIESLHFNYPLVMIMDESGKLNDKPVNLLLPRDTINGDIIFSANAGNGELRSLTKEEIGSIMLFIAIYEVNTDCALK